MYSNSALALRKAASAGLGIALLPRYSVADELANGTLVSLLQRYLVPSRTLFAIYPSANTTPAKVRIFVDFLIKWMITRGVGTADTQARNAG
jgi:DNA-binding transcriptional LysR family regulator